MIEMKVVAGDVQELSEIFAGLGRMVSKCVETKLSVGLEPAGVEAPAVEAKPVEVQKDELEYEDVTEPEKPKTKRTRKKKTAAKEEAPPEEPIPSGLTRADVQAELVKAREREGVGVDKVRQMLAEMGGMLKDIPEEQYPEVVRRARALV